MPQKRSYEAVTGNSEERLGLDNQDETTWGGDPVGPKAKVPKVPDRKWVRTGYVPEDEKVRAFQEKEEEIKRLRKAIREREEALALKAKQSEISRLRKSIKMQEEKLQQDKIVLDQKKLDEKLAEMHQQERKEKIKRSFQMAFKVKDPTPTPQDSDADKAVPSVTQSDVDGLLNCPTDYQCLQVEAGERVTVIKKKYKELARAFHPDKCKLKGAKEAFQRLNRAYQNLLKISK